jgi:hypothetical protein
MAKSPKSASRLGPVDAIEAVVRHDDRRPLERSHGRRHAVAAA